MKKVLVYGNRKMDDMCWDASTPILESLAYLKLFTYLDECEMYCEMSKEQQKLYTRVKELRDATAAKQLLVQRKQQGHEYETEWRFVNVL